ncbi:hypothetical protein MPSEU_000209500 [Mayamaea pseudoterrestris]|nr:hypothetical protein MPSEU_000209500 [Mayamaea pseudoterrestris]
MPGISLPRLRSPFRNRRRFVANGSGSSRTAASFATTATLPLHVEEAEQDTSESSSSGAVDGVNIEQLRSALCAFLGIEEGRENSAFLNRYIETFCAASAIMGETHTLGNILGQSEDEFLNTLEICRFISEQFEMEMSNVHLQVPPDALTVPDTTNIPPARDSAIANLPHERILPADRLNFQHDKTCCPICFESLIDGVVLTRLPCGHLYHQNCAVTWLSRSGSCPECRFELPTAMGDEYEEDRSARMKLLRYNVVRCACEHARVGVHTCFFRDRTKLLCEQVTTRERRKKRKPRRRSSSQTRTHTYNDTMDELAWSRHSG